MNPKAALMASTRSGGPGSSPDPQSNSRPPIAPLMPTQGPKSSPGTTPGPPGDVQHLRGALSEEKTW